jgi:hypothetical protein
MRLALKERDLIAGRPDRDWLGRELDCLMLASRTFLGMRRCE